MGYLIFHLLKKFSPYFSCSRSFHRRMHTPQRRKFFLYPGLPRGRRRRELHPPMSRVGAAAARDLPAARAAAALAVAAASSTVTVEPNTRYSIFISDGGAVSAGNGATTTFATTTVVA